MTIAQTKAAYIFNKIIEYRFDKVITCIKLVFCTVDSADLDETCDSEHVNTFIFTFNDDSALKIDCDGDVYLDDDYQNAYNIFN